MAGIKIQIKDSKRHVIFLNKNSNKFEVFKKLIAFEKKHLNSLASCQDFKLVSGEIHNLIVCIEFKLGELLNNKEFVQKEKGQHIIYNNESFYLDTKLFKVDRLISTLNSILKISKYALEIDSPLSIVDLKEGFLESKC